MTYLREVIFTAIVCGVLSRTASLKKNGTGKYVKFAASLAFLIILVSPLIDKTVVSGDILSDISQIAETGDIKAENKTEDVDRTQIIAEAICAAAAKNASEKFAIPESSFSFSINLSVSEKDKISIKSVRICIKIDDEAVTKSELEKHFDKIFDCPTEVIII